VLPSPRPTLTTIEGEKERCVSVAKWRNYQGTGHFSASSNMGEKRRIPISLADNTMSNKWLSQASSQVSTPEKKEKKSCVLLIVRLFSVH
jgi:hypothetical protein